MYCPQTKEAIVLSKRLPRDRPFSMNVLLGSKQVPVRLVAIPLDQATVEYRIRKAKKNRDRRNSPQPEKLARLSWAIYITSVPEEVWSPKQVAQVYRVRWNIELIFKSWKSTSPIVSMLRQVRNSEEKVRILLTALLLHSILILWPAMKIAWSANRIKQISWTKLVRIITMLSSIDLMPIDPNDLAYYAEYDTRKRPNLVENLRIVP